jgi:hypothetical protein
MAQIQTKFIANDAVTNAKLAAMPTLTIKGNNTGGSGQPLDLTVAQVNLILPVFTSTLNGLAPLSGGGSVNFLRADGTWAAPPGATSGTVTSVSVVTANGVSGTVATSTTTPAITLTLGAITPSSIVASGTISGSNLSGTNTGDVTLAPVGSSPNADAASLSGQVLTLQPFSSAEPGVVLASGGGSTNFLRADGTWAAPAGSTLVIGTFNSQASSANGLVIAAGDLYAQAATTTNPGMVIVPAAGGLVLSGASLSINTAGGTISVNGSNQLEALAPQSQQITLASGDITNQYVDLAHAAFGASATNNSVHLGVYGGPQQLMGVDFTVALTGGAGGVTRITFAGDLATAGNAALVAGDILMIEYSALL